MVAIFCVRAIGTKLVLPTCRNQQIYYSITLKFITMLYMIAVILIIGWLLGFFVFSAGSIIHVLLIIAIVAILLRLIQGRNPV